jgi:hypothetical protein
MMQMWLCRQESALQAAIRMLLRSAACMCQHYALSRGLQLPMHWSPFAWLALVHEASQGGDELWQLCGAPQASSQAPAMHACFLDHEDVYGEWSLIQVGPHDQCDQDYISVRRGGFAASFCTHKCHQAIAVPLNVPSQGECSPSKAKHACQVAAHSSRGHPIIQVSSIEGAGAPWAAAQSVCKMLELFVVSIRMRAARRASRDLGK